MSLSTKVKPRRILIASALAAVMLVGGVSAASASAEDAPSPGSESVSESQAAGGRNGCDRTPWRTVRVINGASRISVHLADLNREGRCSHLKISLWFSHHKATSVVVDQFQICNLDNRPTWVKPTISDQGEGGIWTMRRFEKKECKMFQVDRRFIMESNGTKVVTIRGLLSNDGDVVAAAFHGPIRYNPHNRPPNLAE